MSICSKRVPIESIPLMLLSPSGISVIGPIPPILTGYSALFQGYVFSNAAANGSYAVTDGHEVRFF
ncbi:MAG: hypothetical protein ACI97A_003203 [Planctomycetota bacterium]|jgi:hypothetical protein